MTNTQLLEEHVHVTVGVLALQGGFHEHKELLEQAAANVAHSLAVLKCEFVRTPQDLARCDALIIPGGESTTITLLANKIGLMQPLREFIKEKPVWGTCAGMICLAESIYAENGGDNRKEKHSIGGVDISVVRNQYGRQLASFEHPLDFQGIRDQARPFTGVFIRAPIVHHLFTDASERQEILATVPIEALPKVKAGSTPLGPDAHIVALKQGNNKIVSSFHPELTTDSRVHEYFLEHLVIPYKQQILSV